MVALHWSWWLPSAGAQDGSSEKVMCQHSAAMDNTSEERPDYTKAHIPRKSNNSRGIVVRIFYRQVEKKYLSRYIIIWKSRLHFRHPSSFRWWQHVLSRGFLATSAISVAASAADAPSWGKHSRSSLSLQTLLGANILDQALGRWPTLRRRNPSPWELTSKPWQGSPSPNLRRRGQRLRIGWGRGEWQLYED